MVQQHVNDPPARVTDLVALFDRGRQITINTSFEILPVDFHHRNNPFEAYIFLCRYTGEVDGRKFRFRKCYARGCPHNLCPHVSQAVMIANRYLQRDYRRLQTAGLDIEQRLFTLEDMVVKYEALHEDQDSLLTLPDYINIAREDNAVAVSVALEYVDAVEHFASHKNAQTFLNGEFKVTALGRTSECQRCFACYPTDGGKSEKQHAIKTANARLTVLYEEFDQVSIDYEKRFFDQ